MYKNFVSLLLILALTLSASITAFSSENILLDISNVDESIPRSSIISQEIIYIGGVPVLFETYRDGEFKVDIASLLEATPDGYRVVKSGEDINFPMPRNFIEMLLSTHDQLRQIEVRTQAETYGDRSDSRISNSGNRNERADSPPSTSIGGGLSIPGTRVEQWYPWYIGAVLLGSEVWIGHGGMRATVLQVAPAENITLTETITINSQGISPSFPPGFGISFSPHTRARSISASNTLLISTSRESFHNVWPFPTGTANLVTIDTMAVSGIREGWGVYFGHSANVSHTLAQIGFGW